MPEVSVVIPAYNSARFIGEALQSVFDQTFKDYEIIVVDDGSTDSTKQVIDRYGNKIRYVFQQQGGPAKARNRGIRDSLGRFIAFLDAEVRKAGLHVPPMFRIRHGLHGELDLQ